MDVMVTEGHHKAVINSLANWKIGILLDVY